LSGDLKSGNLTIGKTPASLVAMGLPQGNIVMSAAKLVQARKDGQEVCVSESFDAANRSEGSDPPAPIAAGAASIRPILSINNAFKKHYHQSYSDGPRGRVTFSKNKSVTDLFQQRDLSTFLHEMGHVLLEELQSDAALDIAPDQLKQDWQTVLDWFASNGHQVNGEIPTEAHELWARGIERYMMEGNASSSALRKVFDTVRSWMFRIYGLIEQRMFVEDQLDRIASMIW
jgi:hypothetical protein